MEGHKEEGSKPSNKGAIDKNSSPSKSSKISLSLGDAGETKGASKKGQSTSSGKKS